MLIGQGHHRASWRLNWIGNWLTPTRKVITETAACQFLQEQSRYIAATIPPYINQQSWIIVLGQITAVEFRVTTWAHIWYVDVAHLALRDGMDGLPVFLYPLAITCRSLT